MRNELRPLRYTTHARRRMEQRNISKAEVEQIVRAGARRADGIGKWVAFGRVNGRRLEVAYAESEEGKIEVLLVVTVIDGDKGW